MAHSHCCSHHVDSLGVLSWLLEIVWALDSPMFIRTTSETATLLLILLERLLALLLKLGILLDTSLSLGLVGVEVLLHHVGDRGPFVPFSIRVLCSRVLLNTQMANDILN